MCASCLIPDLESILHLSPVDSGLQNTHLQYARIVLHECENGAWLLPDPIFHTHNYSLGFLIPLIGTAERYIESGSATIDFLLPLDVVSSTETLCPSFPCLFSSPSCSSCFGVNSAVILRSRAARSDLSCFNSSSLPHCLATMDSSWGTSALSLAVRSSY